MEKDKIVSIQDIRRLSEDGVPVLSCLIIMLSFKYKCNITLENIEVMLSNRYITYDMLKAGLLNEGFYNMQELKEISLLEKFYYNISIWLKDILLIKRYYEKI